MSFRILIVLSENFVGSMSIMASGGCSNSMAAKRVSELDSDTIFDFVVSISSFIM